MGSVVFEIWSYLPSELNEMMGDEADDMKTIGNDFSVREPGADKMSIRAGEINTDNPYFISALEFRDKRGELLAAAAWDNIKNTMVF